MRDMLITAARKRLMERVGWLLVLLLGMALALPGGAAAAAPQVEIVTPHMQPGGPGMLALYAPQSPRCTLRFSGPAGRKAGPFAVRMRKAHVTWSWQVAMSATPGASRVSGF